MASLSYEYFFHVLGAIVTASQAENYDACNTWIKEMKNILASAGQVALPKSCKQYLVMTLLQIRKSDKLVGLEELVGLIAEIKEGSESLS